MRFIFLTCISIFISCKESNPTSNEDTPPPSSSSHLSNPSPSGSSSSIHGSSSSSIISMTEEDFIQSFSPELKSKYKESIEDIKCEYAIEQLFNPLIVDYRVEETLGDSLVKEMAESANDFYLTINNEVNPDPIKFTKNLPGENNEKEYSIVYIQDSTFFYSGSTTKTTPGIETILYWGLSAPKDTYTYENGLLTYHQFKQYKSYHYSKFFYLDNHLDSIDVDKLGNSPYSWRGHFKFFKNSSNCQLLGYGGITNHHFEPKVNASFQLSFNDSLAFLTAINSENAEIILDSLIIPRDLDQDLLDTLTHLKSKQLELFNNDD